MFERKNITFILIGVLLAMIISILLLYFFWPSASPKSVISQPEDEQTKILKSIAEEDNTLAFNEDVKRFLKAYFEESFPSDEAKHFFIKREYYRFSQMSPKDGVSAEWMAVLLPNLKSLVSKIERNNFVFLEEEAALQELRDKIK